MKVYIIVLHYGDVLITRDCLESIIEKENKYKEIIIVDNDLNSPWKLKKIKNTKLIIITGKQNLGYAKGMNLGIKYALSKNASHILLLNNDILFTKAIISPLVQFLQKNEKRGIISPAIRFNKRNRIMYDVGGKINRIFGRTSHREIENISHQNIEEVDYISGCCMLINATVFRKIGLLDERYFLYYEDVDFCLRAKAAEFKIFIYPLLSLDHALSKTVGKSSSLAIYHQIKSAFIFGDSYFKKRKFTNNLFIYVQIIIFFIKNPLIGKIAIIACLDNTLKSFKKE